MSSYVLYGINSVFSWDKCCPVGFDCKRFILCISFRYGNCELIVFCFFDRRFILFHCCHGVSDRICRKYNIPVENSASRYYILYRNLLVFLDTGNYVNIVFICRYFGTVGKGLEILTFLISVKNIDDDPIGTVGTYRLSVTFSCSDLITFTVYKADIVFRIDTASAN